MTMTNEEMLELAKKCGAKIFHKEDSLTIVVADNHSSGNATQFVPKFASAIEEKYQAQIAGLVKESKRLRKGISEMSSFSDNDALLRLANDLLSFIPLDVTASQATADAFIAEVKASERKALADWMDAHSISHVSANWLRSPSAELRNQSQAEGSGK